eukprot:scaffold126661_cov28-Tisochrysis_lutea.AAC.6
MELTELGCCHVLRTQITEHPLRDELLNFLVKIFLQQDHMRLTLQRTSVEAADHFGDQGLHERHRVLSSARELHAQWNLSVTNLHCVRTFDGAPWIARGNSSFRGCEKHNVEDRDWQRPPFALIGEIEFLLGPDGKVKLRLERMEHPVHFVHDADALKHQV